MLVRSMMFCACFESLNSVLAEAARRRRCAEDCFGNGNRNRNGNGNGNGNGNRNRNRSCRGDSGALTVLREAAGDERSTHSRPSASLRPPAAFARTLS